MSTLPKSRLSIHRALAIARHESRILFRDPTFVLVTIGMPLAVMAFVTRVFRAALVGEGYHHANGSEQSVPGMTIMFCLFLVGSVGYVFFREHGWNTWERLRASRARPFEILVGKSLPIFIHALCLQLILFGFGIVVFGLRFQGSLFAAALIACAFSVCLVTLGVAIASVCRTAQQNSAICNVGTMLLAGLGGAIAPSSTLPFWAKIVAPITPSYWAMRGYRGIILNGKGVPGTLGPVFVLFALATLFAICAILRFRFEETKIRWM